MRSTIPPGAAVLLLALAPLGCLAQASPYVFGLSQTFSHDSNLFRLPGRSAVGTTLVEPESSGLIATTQLRAGLDQAIGRQRLYGDLSLGHVSYRRQPDLDGPRYKLAAGVDWDTVDKLSGKLQLDAGRRLGAYGDRDLPQGKGNNDERYRRVALLARSGDPLRSRVWLQAEVVRDELRNELQFRQPAPLTSTLPPRDIAGLHRKDVSTAYALGLRHRWAASTVVGVGVRTESRVLDIAQQLTSPAETVSSVLERRRNDLDLVLDHRVADRHELSARLSYGRTDFHSATATDSSDWSSSLNWSWRASAKLHSQLRLLHDTEDRELGSSAAGVAADSRQTTAVEWQLDYAASAKLAAQLGATWRARKFGRDLGAFTDHDSTVTAALKWAALRSTTLGCAVARARRSSTLVTAFGRDHYDATTWSCSAELVLR